MTETLLWGVEAEVSITGTPNSERLSFIDRLEALAEDLGYITFTRRKDDDKDFIFIRKKEAQSCTSLAPSYEMNLLSEILERFIEGTAAYYRKNDYHNLHVDAEIVSFCVSGENIKRIVE